MTGLLIEGGIYALLLFTPFAFGGVEMWARGVLQIVAGLVVAAWAWDRLTVPAESRRSTPAGLATWTLAASIVLFVVFVLFQLLPLPASWIRALSPGTHALYVRTLPGYDGGLPFETSRLPSWLLAGGEEELSAAGSGTGPPAEESRAVLDPPVVQSGLPLHASASRTLSIYPHETWQRLSILLSHIGLFGVTASWFRTRDRLARLLAVAVVSGFALSIVGILQKLTWNGKLLWFREGTYDNVFGPFVNRNSYAAFAATVLPIAVCMALNALRHREARRPGSMPRLLLWGFAAVAICGGVFYSLSRGGILTATLSLAMVALLLLRHRRGVGELAVLGAMGLAAALFLVWIGPEKVIERVGTLSEGQSIPSMELRAGAWQRSTGLIESSPWVGSGLGTYRFAFLRFAPPGEGWWTEAHNEYLELICDTGAVGGALFVLGLVSWLVMVARPSVLGEGTERYLYVGLVAGIAGLLVHSAVSSNLQIPANGLLLSVLGAALVGLVGSQSARRRARWP